IGRDLPAARARGSRGLSCVARVGGQGRRLCDPGPGRALRAPSRRILLERRGAAALRDRGAARGEGLRARAPDRASILMRRLLIAATPGELRGAVTEAEDLADFRLVRTVSRSAVGDVVLGRVVRLQPALRAALIDIGQERPAYLSADDAVPGQSLARLTEGSSVLVQVKRDARADKAAAVTLRPRLPGRWLDWTPARPGVGAEAVAPKRRDRVTTGIAAVLREGEGVRIRPAAAAAPSENLAAAIATLRARWAAIEERRARAEPPACLETVPPLARLLEAFVDEAVEEIVV